MNFIYRIGLLAAMIIASLTGFGQGRAQKLFDRFNNEAGFTSFSFSKTLIDAMNLNLDEEGKKITGDFQECKVLIYNPEKGKIKRLDRELSKELNAMHYEQVHPKGEKSDDNAEFWIEGTGDLVTECHIILGNNKDAANSTLLVSFYGRFKVQDLKKLERIGQRQAE